MRWRFCVEEAAAEVASNSSTRLASVSWVAPLRRARLCYRSRPIRKLVDYLKQAQSIIRANLPPGTQIPYVTQSESAKGYGSPPSQYYFDGSGEFLPQRQNLTLPTPWSPGRPRSSRFWGQAVVGAHAHLGGEAPQPEQLLIDLKQHVRRATDGVHAIYALWTPTTRSCAGRGPLQTGSGLWFSCLSVCCSDAEYAGLVPVTLVASGCRARQEKIFERLPSRFISG